MLARYVGIAGALKFSDEFGGTHVHVPTGPVPDDHILARRLGRRLADVLCKHFHGETLRIAGMKTFAMQLRNERIRVRRAEGVGLAPIGREFGVSERQVYNILHQGAGKQ